MDPAFPSPDFTPLQSRLSPSGWLPLSWLGSHPLWAFSREEVPNPSSGARDEDFNPRWSSRAGQGGYSNAEPKISSQTFTKISPSPIPAFPPSRENSDLTFAGAAALLTPKQSWGRPKMRGSLPVLPGASLLWKRDLAFGIGGCPGPGLSRALQALQGADPTTQILYLQHRGDSRALRFGLGHPEGPRAMSPGSDASGGRVGSFLGRSRRPRWAPKRRCSYCSRWPWRRPGRR